MLQKQMHRTLLQRVRFECARFDVNLEIEGAKVNHDCMYVGVKSKGIERSMSGVMDE